MEQCEYGLGPSMPCPNDAVLWGKCEKHLTPRERAVWALVQVAERAVVDGAYAAYMPSAIAAVKES